MKFSFDLEIKKVEGIDGAYVEIPIDIKKEFGKGRLGVNATFDGVAYTGSIVNMGVNNPDGSVCYILGIRKDIRQQTNKQPGDIIRVEFEER